MEVKNNRQLDMFDYIGEGRTMYNFIDNQLNGYLGGDFSLNSLVNHSRTFGADISPEIHREQKEKVYKEIFSELVSSLTYALETHKENTSQQNQMSEEEKNQFLKKMQDLLPDTKLDSISAYIELVLANNFGEVYYENLDYYSALNEIIVDTAIKTLSDADKAKMKQFLLKYTYIAQVGNMLKEKYPDRYEKEYPEWEEFEFIRRTLSDPSKFRKYDDYIQAYEDYMKAKSESIAISMSCKAKRERYVINAMVAGMTEEEQKSLMEEKTIESVVFKKPENLATKAGSYVWGIKPYSSPQVVLDTIAEYSKDGIENQRVIAVSYGKFEYGTLIDKEGKPAFTSDELELVGITRMGKDGSRNYFVLMPVIECTIKKEQDCELKQNSSDKVLKTDINGDENSQAVYIETVSKLSGPLKDFYARVALSDNYLSAAMYGNFKFAGRIKQNMGKPGLDATYKSSVNDLEAAVYASKYSGKTPDGRESTLEEYCRSAEFLAMHFNILNELQKSRENAVREMDNHAFSNRETKNVVNQRATVARGVNAVGTNTKKKVLERTPNEIMHQENDPNDKKHVYKSGTKKNMSGGDIEHV